MPEKLLPLQPRLQALAEWSPPGCRLADVGTDHGYLPVYLLQRGQATYVIASDIKAAPLEHARRSAMAYGVEKLDLRLCDGLAQIAPEEVDTVVIAGMGGETIAAILTAAPWTMDGAHALLLQPMSRAELLRSWLYDRGYHVRRERLVEDKGVLYPILEAAGGVASRPSPGRLHSGVALGNDPLWGEYLDRRMAKLTHAQKGLEQGREPAAQERAATLRTLLAELNTLRKEWSHAQGT